MRIGVFICHCGLNIAGVIDVKKVAAEAAKIPGVVYADTYIYMCSEPGQQLVEDKIKEFNLDGVVVSNCSPSLHERTFRNAAARAGLNPYRVEIANIREQCSWPHQHEPEVATKKAIKIVKATIERVKRNMSFIPPKIPVTKKALVIGGGIAGIQAALDIADGGYEVYLVERDPSIGGKMILLSETFPTLDCPQCIETPKMTDASQHPKIHLMTYSEVDSVSGYVGNFKVKIRHKASYVDWSKCLGCGDCVTACPVKGIPSEVDRGLSDRKAIYIPFDQAVPLVPVIDADHCTKLKYEKKVSEGKIKRPPKPVKVCEKCQDACVPKIINFEDFDKIDEVEVGAIIVATGFELMPIENLPEYGAGKIPDVIDGLQFERLLCASGPTSGVPKRPSNGKVPKSVVFVSCAGSRDPEHGVAYCSRICCMYLAKQAMLYKHAIPDGKAYIFYIDIRSNGKGYEEFVQRAKEEDEIVYIRGKVSKIFQKDGKVVVWGADTLTGQRLEIESDLVVLATAMLPSPGVKDLASKLRIPTDTYGWLQEAHLKLRPLETVTAGVFIAGASQSPKDITDTVSQASGAAGKVLAMFSKPELSRDPLIAEVDSEVCAGCGYCENACAYGAAKVDPARRISVVNEAMCEGCGACAVACPSGAMKLRNLTFGQVFDMVTIATEEY
ncbi:MAG: disulfide reductase [Candidatus Cloacimonas sp. 4484_209]|nr:MAG: disulfide reductase [Candidatus Cloacimonas sp. 4484_209]